MGYVSGFKNIKGFDNTFFIAFLSLSIVFFSLYALSVPLLSTFTKSTSESVDPNYGLIPYCEGEVHTPENTVNRSEVSSPLSASEKIRVRLTMHEREVLPFLEWETPYTYSEQLNAVAYISGYRWPREDQTDIRTVYIHYLNNGAKTEVFDMKNIVTENEEYVYGLVDVSFSPDSSQLAITTSEDVYIYNLSTNELKHEFRRKREGIRTGGVWSYYNVRFNHDNSKLLIDTGYYEGHGAIIYDRKSGEIQELPYMIYSYGDAVLDWYGDKLVVYEHTQGEKHLFKLVDPLTFEQKAILEFAQGYMHSFIDDSMLYVTTSSSRGTGKYRCLLGEKQEISAVHNELLQVNIETKEVNSVLELDLSGYNLAMKNVEMVKLRGKERLLILFSQNWERTFSIEEFDQSSSTLVDLKIEI